MLWMPPPPTPRYQTPHTHLPQRHPPPLSTSFQTPYSRPPILPALSPPRPPPLPPHESTLPQPTIRGGEAHFRLTPLVALGGTYSHQNRLLRTHSHPLTTPPHLPSNTPTHLQSTNPAPPTVSAPATITTSPPPTTQRRATHNYESHQLPTDHKPH